jgi:hypothetical protein
VTDGGEPSVRPQKLAASYFLGIFLVALAVAMWMRGLGAVSVADRDRGDRAGAARSRCKGDSRAVAVIGAGPGGAFCGVFAGGLGH